jgi:RNA polymerase sigma factor (sigma-70 family)
LKLADFLQFALEAIGMEEREFIAQLRGGDARAFDRLVTAYQSRVFNTCLGFVFAREEAEDLTQEVFVEVYRSIAGFEERSSLSTWIYRIAVTKSLESIRHHKRKKRAGVLLSIFGLQQAGWDARAPAIDHPGVRMENQERAQHLHRALQKLPENQRIAFTLHNLDAQSYEEVASVMGISISSVESLMFRARKNLQKTLEKFYKSDR